MEAFIDDRQQADQRDVIAVLGGDDPHAACRGGEGSALNLAPDRVKQLRPVGGDAAADHDHFRIQDVDQAGTQGADGHPGAVQHGLAGSITLVGGFGHVLRAELGGS